MATKLQNILIAATPTHSLLSPLLHALSRTPFVVTLITRKTYTTIHLPDQHRHHSDEPTCKHHHTTFTPSSLSPLLAYQHIIICLLSPSDLHLTHFLISAIPETTLFIPSEFGLATSCEGVRELLPPYNTRWEIQSALRAWGGRWNAVYTGVRIEDGLLPGGVLGIDALWGSCTSWAAPGIKVAMSSTSSVVQAIISAIAGDCWKKNCNELYAGGAFVTQEEIAAVVEEEIGKVDRYEGLLDGARKEAEERMQRGFFDGGVGLLEKIAVWDESVGAWDGWKVRNQGGEEEWREDVRRLVGRIRKGDEGGRAGCGC